jgi:hypothetical protein
LGLLLARRAPIGFARLIGICERHDDEIQSATTAGEAKRPPMNSQQPGRRRPADRRELGLIKWALELQRAIMRPMITVSGGGQQANWLDATGRPVATTTITEHHWLGASVARVCCLIGAKPLGSNVAQAIWTTTSPPSNQSLAPGWQISRLS